MSPLDLVASALTLVNVALIIRRSLWNYPFGLAAVALSAAVFWREKLYSDVVLQGFFFLVQFYGWYVWTRHREADGAVAVSWLDADRRVWTISLTAEATLGWGWMMQTWTSAAFPLWDAVNLMMSVVAQLLMSRRFAENWIVWIVVDVSYVGLYCLKHLIAFTALYVVLTALAVWGFAGWWHAGRRVLSAAG